LGLRTMLRTVSVPVAVAALLLAVGGAGVSAQTATWYIATYTHDVLVWDEASEEIVDRIEMNNFIPTRILVNEDQTRLYVQEASAQRIEIVDLASREVVDELTLSHDSVSVRIDGFAPHPSGDRAVIFAKRYTALADRYLVEGPFLLEYDLRSKQVTDTIPWPDDEPRDRGVGFRYSPDGETLYFFVEDIIAVDADTYEEVDRWEISEPLEPGLGRPSFGVNPGTYDEDGVATGLYRMRDPIQNRNMMGVAEVRLSEKEVDFYTLGPSEPVGSFALAPGGEKAYALYTSIGHYEFWEFDLMERRVARKHPFAGRPRMGLRVSADGEKLYVFVAGNTIDVYDTGTFELLRTVEFDADMIGTVVIPGG
jgi:DNA-binding beta-propeller fold protein YncE